MKEATYQEAIRRKYPESISVVVCIDAANNRPNIITLGWVMCVSSSPPMLVIAVGNTRHSCQNIREGGEFVLAFPHEDQIRAMLYCGSHSGRTVDKFKESGFLPFPAKIVKPPLIVDALANFECRVVNSMQAGDHTIFVGEVVASHMSEKEKNRIYTFKDGSFRMVKG